MAFPSSTGHSAPLLVMRGIRKTFGAVTALDGVDFDVQAGEVHALVGENGSGKSTLMKIVSGAEPPDGGTMRLEGAPFRPRSPLEARRHGVGMIYQELSLAPHLTVEENISLGQEETRWGIVSRNTARQRARAALERMGHTELPLDEPVRRLSVSERQIVEIARAVASGCRVLVFDEPTSSLGGEDVRRLFRLIRALKENGHAIVYISHALEEVKATADRVTVLRDGHVAGGGPAAELSLDEIVRLMIGRRVEQLYPRSPRHPGEVILEVKEVGGVGKPTEASLALRRGEVLGLAGLLGSGRTELLRAIFGLAPVRRGIIRVGAYLGPASPAQRWAQGVGLVSEDRAAEGLALKLDVGTNLTLTRFDRLGPAGLVWPRRQAEEAAIWIERLGIRCRGPQQRVGGLSGGNQQKVALARLLYHDVDVLLLDEPTRGIDVASKAQIYALVDQMAAGTGVAGGRPKAVLMVSSYLPELLGVCDRIAVMSRGVLGMARPVSEWNEESLMRAAAGVDAV